MKNQSSKIHPDLRQVAGRSPKFLFSRKYLWLTRRLMEWMPALKTPADILVENIYAAGQDGQAKIRLRIYKSKTVTPPAPVLIWLHGGGYVMGKPEMDDHRCIEYARQAGIVVVSVDYRYAPKHPFPTGLEDAYFALKWVEAHSQQLGVDGKRIAVGGASAGGGLAAALAQLAHDKQEIEPVFQLLVYPMLDDRTALRTDIDDSYNFTWPQENNRYGWGSYLGGNYGAEDTPAYAVPARRGDPSGLPSAWIGVGTLDVFYEEDTAYARRLNACGVDCEMHDVPGAFHGFDVFDPQLPVVQEFRSSQINALKKYLFR